MGNLRIKLLTNLQKKLVDTSLSECTDYFKNLEIRAKGYQSFFGDKVIPFSPDDFFCTYILGHLGESPFFTLKYSSFHDYQFRNMVTPPESLLSDRDLSTLKTFVKDYDTLGWVGGLTYLITHHEDKKNTGRIAKELTAFFICYSLKNYSPNGIIVTANLKAKFDQFLFKCGFEAPNIDLVIHKELDNNPAQLLYLTEPSQYMLDCYYKYLELLTPVRKAA